MLDRIQLPAWAPRLERRHEPSQTLGSQLLVILLAVLLSLLFGGFLFHRFGVNPFRAYGTLLYESFGNLNGLAFTLIKATPLIFAGLTVLVAFKAGLFYAGGEGGLMIGSIAAVWVALASSDTGWLGPLPPVVFFPLVLLVTFTAGGLWAGIVGVAKAKWGGNDVIISLMLNYVALLLVNYLVSGPMRMPGDQPQTPHIPAETRLPFIVPNTRIHAGVLIALACVFLIYFVLRRTRFGYELIVTGANPRAARYGGINTARMLITAAFIAGGLAGLGGGVEVLGVQFRVTDGITTGVGFTGIVVALLGRLNPFGVAVASILYAGLGVGGSAMQRDSGVPISVVNTIQGLIVVILLVVDNLRYYRLVSRGEARVSAILEGEG
jgi:ABC-type uncharacterized transport system permease subunit